MFITVYDENATIHHINTAHIVEVTWARDQTRPMIHLVNRRRFVRVYGVEHPASDTHAPGELYQEVVDAIAATTLERQG